MSQWYCPSCGRVHAHGYRQAEPYHLSWQDVARDGLKDAGEVILGVVVFLGLFLGIPFLLWLVAAS